MPRAGSAIEITTTEKAIFQSSRHARDNGLDAGGLIASPGDGSPCKAIRFATALASAASLRVRIPGLQRASEYVTIPAGESREFVNISSGSGTPNIDTVYVSTASGTATFSYEVIG